LTRPRHPSVHGRLRAPRTAPEAAGEDGSPGARDGPDEIIHQSTRLRMTSILNALGPKELMAFGKLKAILAATDGNMATHLTALEKAGYVAMTKDFVGKKPRTRIALTPAGRRAFARHVAYLKSLIDTE
jgi:DNA-binding MarR family transcriptional regulator